MNRRGFLFGGATALLAAPAIVRVASLMSVSVLPEPLLGSISGSTFDTFALSPAMIHRFKGKILRHAVPLEILGRPGRVEYPSSVWWKAVMLDAPRGQR